MATPSGRQNSRFSTLNVFKFAVPKPPPLPPKDPYYLANPSLPALSQTLSMSSHPNSPYASAYGGRLVRSPSPSPSYAPSARVASSSSSVLSPDSAGSRKGFFKIASLGRRPKTPKFTEVSLQDLQPPEPVDDPSISLPFNFMHNIHVDEGYTGMPPSWSASLANMGFSPEEIAAIHARRMAGRSQSAKSLYSLNAAAQSVASTATTSATPSVLNYGAARSGLQRGPSEASRSQASLAMSYAMSSMSRMHARTASAASEQPSISSLSEADASFVDVESSLGHQGYGYSPAVASSSQTVLPTMPQTPQTVSQARALSPTFSTTSYSGSGKDTVPRTPPRRGYHVANDSISTISSPPPAYKSPQEAGLGNVDESLVLPPLAAFSSAASTLAASSPVASSPVTSTSVASTSVASTSMASTLVDSPSRGDSLHSREDEASMELPEVPVVAPRLSLGQDTLSDLASWSEALFSSLPSEKDAGFSPPAISVNDRPQPAPITRSKTTSPARHAPTPLSSLPDRRPRNASNRSSAHTPSSSNTMNPLWHEVMNMVRPSEGPISASSSASAFASASTISSASPATPPSTSSAGPVIVGSPADDDLLEVKGSLREKENRDSNMSTMTVTPATIVQGAIVRTARANVVPVPRTSVDRQSSTSADGADSIKTPARPRSEHSAESHSSGGSTSSGTLATPLTGSGPEVPSLSVSDAQEEDEKGGLAYDTSPETSPSVSPQPSPRSAKFSPQVSKTPELDEDLSSRRVSLKAHRPSISTAGLPVPPSLGSQSTLVTPSPASSSMPSPLTPAPRYPGWVSEVVAPLRKFIDDATDPRALYGDLREVGEGESGSVYAARVLRPTASASSSTASLPSTARGKPAYVAIKNVPILPSGSPKLLDLQRELAVTHGLRHNHILAVDAVYVDHVEDALWLRMELMERSLADVIGLGEEGILIQEKQIAQFASDIVHALRYLQAEGIAHRDLRSDNLLINRGGIVKLADFSSAVRVSRAQPTRTDPAGVIFWQAPEVRTGSYNALKVDVWSLGATIWELAQGEPPFSDVADPRQIGDTLPALAQPEIYSRSFHDFLRSCSQPSKSRPSPDELLNTPFIRNARWRVEVVTLLQQCRAIEERLSKRQSADSDGTVSMS